VSQARILVVDDDPSIHEVLEAYLGLSGYEVLHAENGEEGLKKLQETVPDLLIIDIQMPGMDGLELLQKMKNNPLLLGIPAIMLSSLERPNIKVKALQLGADDYVVKPFDQTELMARVSVALRRNDARKNMEEIFSGVLGPVHLTELLQTMAHGRKEGKIDLPDMDGEIIVGGKEIVSCRWRDIEGIEAFRRLLMEEDGRFRIHFEKHEAGQGLGSIEDLLLSTLVFLDELHENFSELFSEDMILKPGDLLPGLETAGNKPLSWPTQARKLVSALKGELEENAKLLREMISSGLLLIDTDEGKE